MYFSTSWLCVGVCAAGLPTGPGSVNCSVHSAVIYHGRVWWVVGDFHA